MAKVIAFPPVSPGGLTAASTAGGVFVGRTQELEELRAGLEDACAGHGRLILLVGEPGIGKTRLAHELATYARARGARVLVGRCDESEGAPPFWPWVQIARAYLADRDLETLKTEMGVGTADIAQVIAEVRERLPDVPTPPTLEPQQARFRFFDSFATFLKNAAKARPLVLILDDLPWADPSSLLLLQFLARELEDASVLIVGTYRDVELGPQHPLTQTLGELARTPGSQSLVLRGLTEHDVARFIELTTGQTPADALVTAVYQKTEGNPFFVTEVVHLLVTENPQSAVHTPQSVIGLPLRVREAISHRLQTLSEGCHCLLSIAAVIGREFNLKILQQASGTIQARMEFLQQPANDHLLELLDEAMAARLIAPVPNSAGLYTFSHALIRETLYEALSTAQRIRLHRQIGEALEEIHQVNLEPYVAELAFHFFQAAPGETGEKAITYAQGAGERAMRLLAYEEAVSHYERALQVLAVQKSDEKRHCELLLSLGDALWRAGESLQARDTFVQAAQVAQFLNAADLLARAALGLGNVRAETGVIDEVLVGLLDAALAILGETDSDLRAKVMARLAMALYFSHSAAERRNALSVAALAMAQRVGGRSTLAFALLARHFVLWGPGSVEERLTLATEVVRLAQEAGDVRVALEGQAWRILALFELGDIATVDQEIESYARQSAKVRLPRNQWYLILVRSARAFLTGQFIEGERLATEAAAVQGERGEQANALMFFGAQLFTLRREQGRLGELEPALTGFATQFAALPIWRCSVAVFHCEMGNREAARREFDALATQDFAALLPDANRPPALALLAEACNMLGDAQRAALLYQLLLPYAERNIVVATSAICYGPAARYLGLLATTLARWKDAARHFADALAMSERMGAKPWAAHTRHDCARMLLARGQPGDQQKARELLDNALAMAQDLGMTSLQSKVQGLKSKVQEEKAKRETKNLELSAARPWMLDSRPSSEDSALGTQRSALNCFRQEGDYWTIAYQGEVLRLKDIRGLRYLTHLLRHPHKEFHVLELVTVGTGIQDVPVAGMVHEPPLPGTHVSEAGDAEEVLDAKARAAYKRRLEDLRAELEEAQAYNDPGRADRARQEMDFLTAELAQAFGLQGRPRKVAADAERARVSVARRIIVARQKIAAHNPALERYLAMTIKTGLFCSYMPHPDFPVSWQF
jgi:tetratricopeptide (TPR) repeat protein